MSGTQCVVCGARTDLALCFGCADQIVGALNDLPGDLIDLEAVATRQARGPMGMGDPEREWRPDKGEPRSPFALVSTPWPFAPGAADMMWVVQNTVSTWWRHIRESRGVHIPKGPACAECIHFTCLLIRHRNDPRALLIDCIDSIRVDVAAHQLHDEITSLSRRIDSAVVGRRAADQFLGSCDLADVRVDFDNAGNLRPRLGTCGADLYAREGDREVECSMCGAVYDVTQRKKELAEKVDDQWARPHVIANGLTSLEEPVRPETLRKWIERGHVKQVGMDDDGHALYRVGDVRVRIALARQRQADRASA